MKIIMIILSMCCFIGGFSTPTDTSINDSIIAYLNGDAAKQESAINTEYNYSNEDELSSEEKNREANEKMFLIGQKIKAVNEDESLDEVAITVNGCSITKRSIERMKILLGIEKLQAESIDDEVSLREDIFKKIRDIVMETEAERQGIEGSQDEVDEYIEWLRKTNEKYSIDYTKKASENSITENSFSDPIQAFYAGVELLSMDEYYSETAESLYKASVRDNLWQSYREKYENEIQREAEQRNVSIADVEKEYRTNYEIELIKRAKIEVLDPEVKEIISKR